MPIKMSGKGSLRVSFMLKSVWARVSSPGVGAVYAFSDLFLLFCVFFMMGEWMSLFLFELVDFIFILVVCVTRGIGDEEEEECECESLRAKAVEVVAEALEVVVVVAAVLLW